MNPKEYWELLVDNQKNPFFVIDFETQEVVYMNDPMAEFLGGFEEFIGGKFYDVLKNEVKYDEKQVEQLVPSVNWETEPIHRIRIYDARLDKSADCSVFPVDFGGRRYLLSHCVPVDIEEERSYNLEQAMAKSLEIVQSRTDVLKSFLELLGTFYNSEKSYIYRVDVTNQSISLSHSWISDGGNEITTNIEDKMPVAPIMAWLETRNQVGIIESNKTHTSMKDDSFDNKLLDTFSLNNIVFSVITDGSGTVIAAVGMGNRKNLKTDFCFLQAVSEFIKQEITKEVISNIQNVSYVDLLTGFYRRHYYNIRLENLLKEKPHTLGVIFANVNGLKAINTEFGYAKGDNYIKKAADMLKSNFDTEFYRISGDEFVAFFPECDKKQLGETVLSLQEQMMQEENFIFAIGHAYGEGRYDLEELMKEADNRMFINKQVYYHSANVSLDNISDHILSDLLRFLKNDEFMIYLQPQVRLTDGSLYGAEALIRRFDKTNQKMIFPDQFISLYEKRSVIRHIDIFVVEEVCRLLQRWQKEGKEMLPISVNLSRVTLQEYSIVDTIADICDNYQVPHEYLVIEVTERVGLIENNVASSLIQNFQSHGFRISLDDFGCAYSNIVTLAQLDVDEVKIDKSLVDYVTSNKKNMVLVNSVIKMCEDLGNISNLAEGIENEEQAMLLRDLRCHLAQGYFYSRPLPVPDFCAKYMDYVS